MLPPIWYVLLVDTVISFIDDSDERINVGCGVNGGGAGRGGGGVTAGV
jgi:hypothetical protein